MILFLDTNVVISVVEGNPAFGVSCESASLVSPTEGG
jgi:hypothetical protein